MKSYSRLLTALAASLLAIGCTQPSTSTPAANGTQQTDDHSDHDHGDDADHDHDDHAGHDHADHGTEGPHGGHLIELGHDHAYHAELVDDHKTEIATIYIMDGDMKPLVIEASSVNLILTSGNNSQAFVLKPENTGPASEFKTTEGEFMKMVDAGDVKGKLRVTIEGEPFTGTFDHHAHEGHEGHDHGDHAGHDHDGDDHEGHDHDDDDHEGHDHEGDDHAGHDH